MTTVIQFALLGLGAGAAYSLLATGLIAIYRASGVLNLAHGAFAMVGAFLFHTLTRGDGWGSFPAAVVVLLAVGAIAGVMSLGVMRRLRESSVLMKVIATVAALLVLEASANLIWGVAPRSLPSWLPTGTIDLGEVSIGANRVLMAVIALVLAAGMWAVSKFTRIGVATSAVAENRRAAAALGWSPELIATGNWIVGGMLAALAGILIGPVSGLQVSGLSLLVVPALAVALMARFESYAITFAAAMALGIGQSLMARYVDVPGLADALPLLVIIVVLFVGGKSVLSRGYVAERLAEFGTGRVRPLVVVPTIVVTVLLIRFVMSDDLVIAMIQSIAYAIVFLSIVVLTGYAGQLSLGQMALAGIGALIAGRLVATTDAAFGVAVIAALLGTTAVGVLFALPALRIRGATLAVVTLALGVAVVALIFNRTEYTGGTGGTMVGGQTLLGVDLDPLTEPRNYALFALVCFVLAALVVTNVRRGRVGRALIAVRTNERAAAALGVNVTAAKLYAFSLSAAVAGLGGVVIGFNQFSIIYADLYGTFQSILVVGYAVIGGVGFIAGTLFAALFPTGAVGNYALDEITGGFSSWVPLVGGVGLLIALLQNPNGMASSFAHLNNLLRRRPRAAPPALPEGTHGRAAEATLAVDGLSVHFGATKAVDRVSVTVRTGEVVGLIGPNGAGKTTLIDAVTGFVKPVAGEVTLNGRPLNDASVHRRARAGISRSFQSLELFEDVTVRENLTAASDERDGLSYLTGLVAPRNRPLPSAAVAAIKAFGLVDDLDRLPTELSYGRRRLVAVARAVASEPSILLLDEPAAGLSGDESRELAGLVRHLADDWGIGVLLIEHDMEFVMGACDKIVVLDFGRQIAEGTPDEIRENLAVITAYLGTSTDVDDEPSVPDDQRAAAVSSTTRQARS